MPHRTTGSIGKCSAVPGGRGPWHQGGWPFRHLLPNRPCGWAEVTTDYKRKTGLVSAGEEAELIPPPLNAGTRVQLKYQEGKGIELQVQLCQTHRGLSSRCFQGAQISAVPESLSSSPFQLLSLPKRALDTSKVQESLRSNHHGSKPLGMRESWWLFFFF